MSDKKNQADVDKKKAPGAGSQRKTGDAPAAKARRAVSATSGKKSTKTTATSSDEAGYLSAQDLKHFREVFQSELDSGKEVVDAGESVPGMPHKSAAESADVSPERARRRGRGPQKSPTKVLTSIRLDQEVYEYFRDSGRGWQSRINEFLTEKMQRERRTKRRKAGSGRKTSTGNKSA